MQSREVAKKDLTESLCVLAPLHETYKELTLEQT